MPGTKTANQLRLRREDYKAVKHMNNADMTSYLQRIYQRGYNAGYQAAIKSDAPQLRECAEKES